MTPDGGPAAADVTYGIDIGGTKVLGVAMSRAGVVVAEAREATPKGTRNIVGSHVAAAVARGLGTSLLPEYACADGLASGDLVEVCPVADLVPPEPWFVVTRVADVMRPQVAGLAARLDLPGAA